MNRKIEKIHRCYTTIRQMLIDRGFVEDEDDETTKTQIGYVNNRPLLEKALSQLDKKPRETLDKLTMIRENAMTGEIIYIFFVHEKIGVRTISGYLEVMDKHKPPVKRAILVSVTANAVLTPFAVKSIHEARQDNKTIEHFYISDLLVNITKHQLQPPKIKICTPQEKEEHLAMFNLKKSNLNEITVSDPISRYFGLKIGDVIKITRFSESAGKYNTFRICVDDE